MRAMPELQIAMTKRVNYHVTHFFISPYSGRSSHLDVFPRALRDLCNNMSSTTDSFIPGTFLTILRQVIPQFNELDRSKAGALMGYAQQGNNFMELIPPTQY